MLPIRIDKGSGIPIYIQLGEQIRLLIHQGMLRTGDSMPTVRSLAVELGINANTVARVYHELQSAGLLRLDQGVGTFVAEVRERRTSESDFRAIEEAVVKAIRLAKRAGMTPAEVSQLVETRWREI